MEDKYETEINWTNYILIFIIAVILLGGFRCEFKHSVVSKPTTTENSK